MLILTSFWPIHRSILWSINFSKDLFSHRQQGNTKWKVKLLEELPTENHTGRDGVVYGLT